MGIRYRDARQPAVEQQPKPQPATTTTEPTIPQKYRTTAAADAQALIERAAEKVFEGVPEAIVTEAVRRSLAYPGFSAASAEGTFATFRDEVLGERN